MTTELRAVVVCTGLVGALCASGCNGEAPLGTPGNSDPKKSATDLQTKAGRFAADAQGQPGTGANSGSLPRVPGMPGMPGARSRR